MDETQNSRVHHGPVIHSMNHFVLDLATPGGAIAYFTIFDVGLMRGVGAGRVGLLRVEIGGTLLDRCFAETVGLGARMQKRMRSLAVENNVLAAGTDNPPLQATIRRTPTSESGSQWVVKSSDHEITASWNGGGNAFWLSAPAPEFHTERDYHTTLISYDQAELVVDGHKIQGAPYPSAGWEDRLGRAFSSCHAAMSETAVASK